MHMHIFFIRARFIAPIYRRDRQYTRRMKLVEIQPTRVGNSFDAAFGLIWSDKTLRKFHGPSLSTTPWREEKARDGSCVQSTRKLRFVVDVVDVPAEVRAFFRGDKMRISTKQQLVKQEERWSVTNHIRMHFLGAEFIKMKPTFYLEKIADDIYFGGRIEHHAILPPPLNGIVEGFMQRQTEKEIESFSGLIKKSLAADHIT